MPQDFDIYRDDLQFAPIRPHDDNLVDDFSMDPSVWATKAIQAKAAIQNQGPPGQRVPLSGIEEAGNGGFVQRYSTGNIYWHLDTRAKWVYGAILQKYLALGGPMSFLGYPVTDELPTSNGIGRFNDFKNGSIYFSPQSGAQEIHGRIRDHWRALGAETSYLGFPTFDQKVNFLVLKKEPFSYRGTSSFSMFRMLERSRLELSMWMEQLQMAGPN